MVEAFQDGGFMMWPIALIGAGVLGLAARAAWLIRDRERRLAEAELSLQAILFWGAMSVVLGLLGTVIGWIQVTNVIGLAGEVEPRLVWAGLGITLSTLTFGMLIFTMASFFWFVLRQWSSRALVRERRRAQSAL